MTARLRSRCRRQEQPVRLPARPDVVDALVVVTAVHFDAVVMTSEAGVLGHVAGAFGAEPSMTTACSGVLDQ